MIFKLFKVKWYPIKVGYFQAALLVIPSPGTCTSCFLPRGDGDSLRYVLRGGHLCMNDFAVFLLFIITGD